jgi:hypothetical protein
LRYQCPIFLQGLPLGRVSKTDKWPGWRSALHWTKAERWCPGSERLAKPWPYQCHAEDFATKERTEMGQN